MSRRVSINLALIFLFALSIRLIGFMHGFPFIFHIDEPALVRSALEIRFFPNPGHFDWPHLHYYLNFIVYQLFIWGRAVVQNIGLKDFFIGLFPILWRDPLIFYYLSRVFNAFLGALTILPIFLVGKTLFNNKVATLSALAFCLIPYHVHASHFALIDVPMIFWGAWSLYFSAKVYKNGLLRNYVLAGFFVGLSASTKYNGVFFCIFVVAAHILLCIEREEIKLFSLNTLVKLFSAGLFSVFGFLLGTPYSVLDFDIFISSETSSGAFWQFRSLGQASFWEHILQFFDVLMLRFDQDFGFTFLYIYTIFSFTFFFFKKFRKNAALWLLILPSILLIYYMTGSERIRTHYYMFMYIFVSLIVGYVTANITPMTKRDFNNFFVVLIMLVPMTLSMYRVYLLLQKDTRNLLYDWMIDNVNQTDLIIYDSDTLSIVMEKFSKNRVEEADEEHEMPKDLSEGYLVFVSERDFLPKYANEMVFVVEAVHRRGPTIWVYTIK